MEEGGREGAREGGEKISKPFTQMSRVRFSYVVNLRSWLGQGGEFNVCPVNLITICFCTVLRHGEFIVASVNPDVVRREPR